MYFNETIKAIIVGIVEYNQQPFTNINCFSQWQLADFNRKVTNKCDLGLSVDAFLLAISTLGISKLEWKFADSWGSTAEGSGLTDLVESGMVHVGIPQVVSHLNNLKQVDFANVFTEGGDCFIVCGAENLIKFHRMGILRLTFSSGILLYVASLVGSTFLFWVAWEIIEQRKSFSAATISSFRFLFTWNSTNPPSVIWKLFSLVLVFTYFTVIFGIYNGRMLATFMPKRAFPFKNYDELGEAVENGWRMYFLSKGDRDYAQVETWPQFQSLKRGLWSTGNIVFDEYLEQFFTLIQDDSRAFQRTGLPIANNIFLRINRGNNCICDSMGSSWLYYRGSPISKQNPEFRSALTRAYNWLHETGHMKRLFNKYHYDMDALRADTHAGEQPNKYLKSGQEQVFFVVFQLYAASLLLSSLSLIVEIILFRTINFNSFSI